MLNLEYIQDKMVLFLKNESIKKYQILQEKIYGYWKNQFGQLEF